MLIEVITSDERCSNLQNFSAKFLRNQLPMTSFFTSLTSKYSIMLKISVSEKRYLFKFILAKVDWARARLDLGWYRL